MLIRFLVVSRHCFRLISDLIHTAFKFLLPYIDSISEIYECVEFVFEHSVKGL